MKLIDFLKEEEEEINKTTTETNNIFKSFNPDALSLKEIKNRFSMSSNPKFLWKAFKSGYLSVVNKIIDSQMIKHFDNPYAKKFLYEVLTNDKYQDLLNKLLQIKDPKISQSLAEQCLIISVGLNDLKKFNLFIDRVQNVNLTNDNQIPILNLACENNNKIMVKKLIEKGANVNCSDRGMTTPLHIACEKQNNSIVQYLLSIPNIDVNAKNIVNDTPLHVACEFNNIFATKQLLLRPDVDINIKNISGMKPFTKAILEETKKEIIDLFFVYKRKDLLKEGKDYLQHAALYSLFDIAQLLIEKGIKPINKHFKTAFQHLDIKMMYLFLKHNKKINVNIKTSFGTTPLMFACRNLRKEPQYALETIKLLIEAGADVNAKNESGNTAIFYASLFNKEAVELLLKNGAEVNIKNKDGKTPFDLAATPEILNLLKKYA